MRLYRLARFPLHQCHCQTQIDHSEAGLAIASATTTGPGTTLLPVNFSNFHQVSEAKLFPNLPHLAFSRANFHFLWLAAYLDHPSGHEH